MRRTTLICLMFAWLPALADPLMDFSFFEMPKPEQMRMPQPKVSWIIDDKPLRVCASRPQEGRKDWQGSCSVWDTQSNTCTIVTPKESSHSVLGHLFLACLTPRQK